MRQWNGNVHFMGFVVVLMYIVQLKQNLSNRMANTTTKLMRMTNNNDIFRRKGQNSMEMLVRRYSVIKLIRSNIQVHKSIQI